MIVFTVIGVLYTASVVAIVSVLLWDRWRRKRLERRMERLAHERGNRLAFERGRWSR